jgi:ubiquinone/menaquinone biosynthesis C-methylase UbiE
MLRSIRFQLWRAKTRFERLKPGLMRPGTSLYEQRLQEEIQHYSRVFTPTGPDENNSNLLEPVPPVWNEIERRSAELMRRTTGNDLTGHVLSRLQRTINPRFLSLGSGAGGVEIVFAREVPSASFTCLDVNAELLRMGADAVKKEALPIRFEQADLNTVVLPRREFDVIFCHASLHHVLELERLACQVRNSLRPGGELIVVDIVTSSGYRMWPETRKVVRSFFRTLPARYRLNHTAYRPKRVDDEIWEQDTRNAGMECVRSGDILPVLSSVFRRKLFLPYQSISRRFLDMMYGPNYNLDRPPDAALVDWIWELDCHYLSTGELRPESFFGVYCV